MVFNVVKVISIGVLLLFLFIGYNALPGDTRLYKVIDDNSYDALKFLLSVPVEDGSKVMAPIFTSTAMFPVSGHEPVGTIFFYGIRKDAENFFKGNVSECGFREELINKHNVNYVLSPVKMDCDWEILYDVEGLGDRGNWTIYDVR
jgi:hypothetical protein